MTEATFTSLPNDTPGRHPSMQMPYVTASTSPSSLYPSWQHRTTIDSVTKSVAMNDSRRKKQQQPTNTRFVVVPSFPSKIWLLPVVLVLFCIINVNQVKFFRFVNRMQRDLLLFDTITNSYSSVDDDLGVVKTSSLSSSVTPKEISNGTWSDVKLVIYMTTHLSQLHISFLPCWYDAIQRFEIFRYADLILYTPKAFDPVPMKILQHLSFRNKIIIKYYKNHGYQNGAIQAMIDPFLYENNNNNNSTSWFDGYDWVIRLNPDVLIRNDTWLIQTMMNESIDAIFHDCYNRILYPSTTVHSNHRRLESESSIPHLPKFHTDFTAFRPNAIRRELILSTPIATYNEMKNQSIINAEMHLTMSLWNIYESKRFVYVQGGNNSIPGRCRLEGVHSPILHVHELAQFCPYYYNATKVGIY